MHHKPYTRVFSAMYVLRFCCVHVALLCLTAPAERLRIIYYTCITHDRTLIENMHDRGRRVLHKRENCRLEIPDIEESRDL